ncbi:uncharacterized protein LOC124688316 [Lolium rigidum]|uniref:uncharacterized protein LOC124688316 n=1 Tax=Lolium rigidum TaxID=89674 RepID=UPI001F5CA0ED|nr:uncharacterized protein LOC124688316 [Lolium rigidum]
MASSLSLRSAAGRVLRRSIPQGSFARNPVRFFSGGVGRIESKGPDMAYEEFGENIRKVQKETRSLVEREKLFEKREQRQRVISYFLVPTAVAVWIFGAIKKQERRERVNQANHPCCLCTGTSASIV